MNATGTVVVLTALNVEYRAVRAHLVDLDVRSHPAGTVFEVGRLSGAPGRVALAASGPGNGAAAVLTERAIALFRPAALLFVGVAGALRDEVALGDVVVATRVYEVHGGRASHDGFLVRPRGWSAPHELEQLARHLDRTGEWLAALPDGVRGMPPAVHFAPVAAGDVVLDSRHCTLARRLRRHYNDAVAIEQESAGFAVAAHLNRSVPTLTIRGVSDTASGDKQATERLGWQAAASAHAAAFAMSLVRQVPLTMAPSAA